MSCVSNYVKMTNHTLGAAGIEALPVRLHRKGLFIGATTATTELSYAFGDAPTADQYISVIPGLTIQFDLIVPANKVWVKGDGVAVIGELI